MPPGKEEINNFTGYLEGEVNRLGVKVQTNALATAEDVKKQSPDVVIVATGSKLLRPPMPGIDKSHVLTATEVLQGIKDVKGKIVILGGGLIGAEVAEYLATRGKNVTIVEMRPQIATDVPDIPRSLLILALKENGVKMVTGARAEEITASDIVVSKRGKKEIIPADSVVLALGAESCRPLEDKLGEWTVLRVGDCVKPRRILEAVHEGFEAGAAV
jgi:pyruvate/2-oxoglutarate dehydrogenase complex dihydrolipoamide dehydrogenase (E3) component